MDNTFIIIRFLERIFALQKMNYAAIFVAQIVKAVWILLHDFVTFAELFQ